MPLGFTATAFFRFLGANLGAFFAIAIVDWDAELCFAIWALGVTVIVLRRSWFTLPDMFGYHLAELLDVLAWLTTAAAPAAFAALHHHEQRGRHNYNKVSSVQGLHLGQSKAKAILVHIMLTCLQFEPEEMPKDHML